MKKVNYKSFKSVIDRLDEIFKNGHISVHIPFGNENLLKGSEHIFNPEYHHIDAETVLAEYFNEKPIEKYNKKLYNELLDFDYPEVYKRLKIRLSQTKPNNPAIKRQIISFMKLLSTNPNEAYFVGNLLASIYEAKNFKSKENEGQFATDEEKKRLLDIPLKVLKVNKHIKTFKRGVLYEMLFPEIYQEVLFNENHILNTLINDDNFQHNKKNQPEVDSYIKSMKSKER